MTTLDYIPAVVQKGDIKLLESLCVLKGDIRLLQSINAMPQRPSASYIVDDEDFWEQFDNNKVVFRADVKAVASTKKGSYVDNVGANTAYD